jgi:hypothetical protein
MVDGTPTFGKLGGNLGIIADSLGSLHCTAHFSATNGCLGLANAMN